MIGISLSMCVRDIIDNKISINFVLRIFTGTAFKTEDDWTDSNDIKTYYSSYWSKDPVRAKEIVDELRKSNRIIQPRLDNIQELSISDRKVWYTINEYNTNDKFIEYREKYGNLRSV